MSSSPTQQAVKQFILDEFLPGESPESLAADTPLISGGILDSISTLKLVSHLEDTYGVEFKASEVNADHLDTLEAITAIVDRKVAAK